MENIKRSIRLFFVAYGGLLFQIIAIIAVTLFIINGANYLYTENKEKEVIENVILPEETMQKQEIIETEKEDIVFISQFLDYCNDNKIEEAYNMLSEECIKEKYKTIDIFKEQYINKIFTHKKEYEIEKKEDLYIVEIIEGILQSGSIENRKSITSYYRIQDNVLEKSLYIER